MYQVMFKARDNNWANKLLKVTFTTHESFYTTYKSNIASAELPEQLTILDI